VSKKALFSLQLGDSILAMFADGTFRQEFSPNEVEVGEWKLENGIVFFECEHVESGWDRGIPEVQRGYQEWRAETEAEVNRIIAK
jgi:hypothetical protein